MTNCVVALINGLWSIVVAFLRLILFLVCLPMALISLYMTTMITNRLPVGSFASGGLPVILTFISVILWILMHFIGCYGAFFNHKPSLKAFAVWTIVIAATSFMSSVSIRDDLLNDGKIFKAAMSSDMVMFDWNNSHANNSTEVWNLVQQQGHCCGMNDYRDWDEYRPPSWSKKEYPSSCCLKGAADLWFDDPSPYRCHVSEVYAAGCDHAIVKTEAFILYLHQGLVTFEVFLFFITLLVIFHGNEPVRPVLPVVVTPRHADPREYQRFDGSVYVRQLPANPSYHNQQPDIKYPPLYQEANYQPAPPSYGVSK